VCYCERNAPNMKNQEARIANFEAGQDISATRDRQCVSTDGCRRCFQSLGQLRWPRYVSTFLPLVWTGAQKTFKTEEGKARTCLQLPKEALTCYFAFNNKYLQIKVTTFIRFLLSLS
jgi:hypothetical protein